jgi:membrane protein
VGLWLGATRLFALYIENFSSYKTVYGGLAGAAIYLVFLFLTCCALLIGAEVNEQIYALRHRSRSLAPPRPPPPDQQRTRVT